MGGDPEEVPVRRKGTETRRVVGVTNELDLTRNRLSVQGSDRVTRHAPSSLAHVDTEVLLVSLKEGGKDPYRNNRRCKTVSNF